MTPSLAPRPAYAFGRFVLDLDAQRLTRAGAELATTHTERALLAFMLTHEGRALGRHDILDAVWGVDVIVVPRTVDTFVWRLRTKLGAAAGTAVHIVSVRGLGYRLEVADGVRVVWPRARHGTAAVTRLVAVPGGAAAGPPAAGRSALRAP